MKPKNLVWLLIVTAVVVGLAIWTSKSGRHHAPPQVGKKVLPDLEPNSVARIVVTSPDGEVSVSKTEERWVCDNAFGYAADFETIRKNVLTLADLTVGQFVRIGEGQREELSLQPPGAATNAGTRIELFDGNGDVTASLLLGKMRTRKPSGDQPFYGGGVRDGRYVSPDDGGTVYLVGETLEEFSADPTDWLATDLVNVPAASVRKITIEKASGETVALHRDADKGRVTLDTLGENEEEDSSKLYSVESALSYLRFDNVADPALSDEDVGMDHPSSFTVWTDDREIYRVLIGKKAENGDGTYVRISVEVAPKPDTDTAAESNQEASGDETPSVEEKVASLNATLHGWTYIVASYKTDAMTRSHDELVKEKEQESEEDESAGGQP